MSRPVYQNDEDDEDDEDVSDAHDDGDNGEVYFSVGNNIRCPGHPISCSYWLKITSNLTFVVLPLLEKYSLHLADG